MKNATSIFFISVFLLLISINASAQITDFTATTIDCSGTFIVEDDVYESIALAAGDSVTLFISIPEAESITISWSGNSMKSNDTLKVFKNNGVQAAERIVLNTSGNSDVTIESSSATLLFINNGTSNSSIDVDWLGNLGLTETITNNNCYGLAEGSIIIDVHGTSDTTMIWSSLNPYTTNNGSITNLLEGNYDLTINTGNGCTYIQSYTITEPAQAFTADTLSTLSVYCKNDNTGEINMQVLTGGSSPYFYWIDGVAQSSNIFQNLPANTYNLAVTDNLGCSATLGTPIVSLTEPANVLSHSVDSRTMACFSQNTGTAKISVSGGTAPYTIDWFDSSTGETITNLAAGNYGFTVTDALSCIYSDTIIISEYPELLGGLVYVGLSDQVKDTICEGDTPGSIMNQADATGGSGNRTYQWQFSTNLVDWSDLAAENGNELSFASALGEDTYYRRKVIDVSCGEAYSNIIFLDVVPKYNASIANLNSAYCINDSDVIITGVPTNSNGVFSGNAALINPINGTVTFSPVLADTSSSNPITITYTYTDENNCVSTSSVDVTMYPLPVVDFDLKQVYNFEGGTDSLLGNLGGTDFEPYTYFNNLVEFNPGYAGLGVKQVTYTFTDGNACSNFIQKNTLIEEKSGEISGLADTYCYSSANNLITIDNITNKNVFPGRFYGRGVIDNGDDSGYVNPLVAYDLNTNPGAEIYDTVYFDYYHVIGGDTAIFTLFKSYRIINLGSVEVLGLNAAKTYCANGGSVELSAVPAGGTFSGPAMVGNYFYPTSGSVGENYIFYNYVDLSAGCSITKQDTILIEALPVISFNVDNQFCSNSSPASILGNPRNGDFQGISLIDLGGKPDSVLFTPSPLLVGTENISYIYTEPLTGCTDTLTKTITIDTIPQLSFNNDLLPGYCYTNNPVAVNGLNYGVTLTGGTFFGPGITDATPDDGLGVFNPIDAVANQDNTIFFTYTDANSCTATIQKVINVSYPLVSSIIGLEEDFYCAYPDLTLNIVGSPSKDSPDDRFTFGGAEFFTSDLEFKPADFLGQDSITVTYLYTDNNNCPSQASKKIAIHPPPNAQFVVDDLCINDSTHFTYTGGADIADLTNINWSFGDGLGANTVNPKHQYLEAGIRKVKLSLTNKFMCSDEYEEQLGFSLAPVANFEAIKLCQGQQVSFENNTQFGADNSFTWDFDDGVQSMLEDPEHTFSDNGLYRVKLFVATSTLCADTLIKEIFIRPVVNLDEDNEYVRSFENDKGGWHAEPLNYGDTNSWSWGIPKGILINEAADGLNAWVTNLEGNYPEKEHSAIMSPCFDMSTLTRPMLSFSLFTQAELNRDGAVLQYSTNDGVNWQNVGGITEGINWFNSFNLYSLPGNSNQGWTSDTAAYWVDAMHDLDMVPLNERERVQFRLVFSSDEGGNFEGIGFDNFRIGERTRTVLFEYFTNTESSRAFETDTLVRNLAETISLDLIDIHYHTSYPAGDSLFSLYTSGANSRAAYYGIEGVPYAYLDGSKVFSFSDVLSTPREITLRKQALQDPGFDIKAEAFWDNTEVNINIELQALEEYRGRQLYMYAAVVEKQIPLFSKQREYRNVLRLMLPSPGGEYLKNNWEEYETDNFYYSVTPAFDFNRESHRLIIFVQDEQSKEVLQTVLLDSLKVGTAVDEYLPTRNDFTLYPNPAHQELTLVQDQNLNSNALIRLYNGQGKLLNSFKWLKGTRTYHMNISKLKPGVYFIQQENLQKSTTRKLVVY